MSMKPGFRALFSTALLIAAEPLIKLFAGPAAAAVLKAKGMEPAT